MASGSHSATMVFLMKARGIGAPIMVEEAVGAGGMVVVMRGEMTATFKLQTAGSEFRCIFT